MLLIREKRICPLSLQNPCPVSGKTELHLLDYPQSIFVGLFSLYICRIILTLYLMTFPVTLVNKFFDLVNQPSLYSTAVQWDENYRKLKGDFVLRTRRPARICMNLWLHLEKMLAILFVQKKPGRLKWHLYQELCTTNLSLFLPRLQERERQY